MTQVIVGPFFHGCRQVAPGRIVPKVPANRPQIEDNMRNLLYLGEIRAFFDKNTENTGEFALAIRETAR
jgi:hypothetical protein